MIKKVLIANRGEIACRIIESVQAAGYDAVAVYSDADSEALFTALADESVSLGGNTAAESYLDMEKIIAAAKASQADAIHPGYGFLSENSAFAALCKENNINFIGPSAHAIDVMGNKATAKQLMLSNKVPCIPGYQGESQDNKILSKEAKKIGYPLMVKAAAGGGGRGIRLVENAIDLEVALESARTESLNAFGDDELILEKAVVDGRHIEIQIAADSHGNVIHLCERDCSAQRRHQKVIEEAPSPFVQDTLRDLMGVAAVNVAKAVNYEGVGTVEFLVDAEENFYFLEMNTRLQVEHPVTELILGIDLVDWQLQIADGQILPLEQDEIEIKGHAIEVRIYAENPAKGFVPQTGTLAVFETTEEEGLRIDHGVYSGVVISPYYDSMLAKVIAWGKDREEARRRLIRGLKNTRVLGLTTNKAFLLQLLNEPAFIKGEVNTGFIDEALLARIDDKVHHSDLALAAVLLAQNENSLSGWSNVAPLIRYESLKFDETVYKVGIIQNDSGYEVSIGEDSIMIDDFSYHDGDAVYRLNKVNRGAGYFIEGDLISIDVGERITNIERLTYQPVVSQDAASSGSLKASTEGLVIDILVKEGDQVAKGDTLILVEAMKMEHRHLAGGDGRVTTIKVEKGQQVKNRQVLLELDLEEVEIESA